MSQPITYTRSRGIRLTADGMRVGAVYGLKCPALGMELQDTTPLNAAWRVYRPDLRLADELRAAMLLRSGDAGQDRRYRLYCQQRDAGQDRLLNAYRLGQPVALRLDLPGGQAFSWTGYVRGLALKAAHPDAPVSLETVIWTSGEAEVST